MEWLFPTYFWSLFAVPAVFALFLWSAYNRRKAASRMGDKTLLSRLAATVSPRRRRWKAAMATTGVLFVALALMGPRFGSQIREVKREGVDLIIALDVSASMQAEDIAPSRLERSRNEVKKLLDQLEGDRVGLVLFSGDAFIQCPLTTDYGAVRLFLDVANPSLIPTPGTDFSAALEKSLDAFKTASADPDERRTRALLIISDGENHVANIPDLVQKAADDGVLIYAAGVGETEGVPIPVSRRGGNTRYKQDRQGRTVITRLEEGALKQLSSNGAYFRIARTSSSLHKITESLDRLDKSEFGSEEFEEYEEKFQWPLLFAFVLLFGERIVSDRRKDRSRQPDLN
ncbi:MAG: VWA domain-containing protein [Rhodothermales bacterium]|nr:VWA domain-containing protein [Rhodothermales bacterium]